LKNSLSTLYKLKPSNIILGNGSEGIMANIVRAFLVPGEEVLTSECTFIGFPILAQSVGSILKRVPLTKDYRYDVVALAENITVKTKIIYLSNPNNPTGTYITKQEFDYLMSHVPDHVLVILDEAYFEFAQNHMNYPDSMDYRYDNVITLRTFSKAYGLAGIRVGYGFAHDELITNLTKIKLPFEPNLIAQLGACGAIHDKPHLKRTLENNHEQYNLIVKYLNEKNIYSIPSAANFVTFHAISKDAAQWLFNQMLNLGVIIRPLINNDLPDFVRVSIGTKDEMNHFYESFDSIYQEWIKLFGLPRSSK
jgi:histidinol-phosphate aminotransferase